MISKEHANVIINLGQAKARDIITIIEEVAGECRRKHGLDLELEIRIVGEA
jgi:UDP-N-acetylmuramate dehydrogenase